MKRPEISPRPLIAKFCFKGLAKLTSHMNTIERDQTKFKLELAKEWLMLQTHKWRRPKWVKFPRSMLDDARWLKLSAQAKAAWVDIILIASEKPNSELPEPVILFRRLRVLGHCQKKNFFAALIDELIQCGFLVRTSPELQSLRVTEFQRSVLRTAGLAAGEEEISEKRLGEEEMESPSIEQPKPSSSPPGPEEMNGIAGASPEHLSYAAALGSFRPVKSRFDRH